MSDAAITLESSFVIIVGRNEKVYAEEVRRTRWKEWKRIAIELGHQEVVDAWAACSECAGCIHLDGDWCREMGLPASVEWDISFDYGIPGVACSGKSYKNEAETGQMNLF